MKHIANRAKVAAAVVALAAAGSANAAITHWLTQAQSTTGNVTADNTGWTFDGTAGVAYDYGNLDELGGKPVDGATVEYIFNFSNAGSSVAIGAFGSWSPGGEQTIYKLEQWPDTGKIGLTAPGFFDYTMATDSPFDQDVHVVFRRNNDTGTMDLFINGVFAEQNADKTNWRMDGGLGYIGANHQGNADVATGDMYGVASYDVALSNQEIADLYSAYTTAVPEPSSAALLGLGGLAMILRRRK